MDQTVTMFIDELVADEELRHSFFRNPGRTLHQVGEWGLPLCDSEISALIAMDRSVWECVAEDLISRVQEAAERQLAN